MHMLLQDVQPQGGVMRADLIPPQYIFLLMDDALGCHRERNQPRAVSRRVVEQQLWCMTS